MRLKKVGAWPFVERLEKGIDHPVVEKGSAFSSGERQLISFARTLYMNPKILILDEATSHIDTETEEIIQTGYGSPAKGPDHLYHCPSLVHYPRCGSDLSLI